MSSDWFKWYNCGVIFACAVTSAETEAQACLLAESVRANGGRYAGSDLWALLAHEVYHLTPKARTAFEQLGVHSIPFEIDPVARGFPFAGKVLASSVAESLAQDRADQLVWLDSDSIIFREPAALLLDTNKALGCRPVDHVLIGSAYDQPADGFWQAIYKSCAVPQERLFPMTTSVDQATIRPYFNAGMLVVRPGIGLLKLWRDNFIEALAMGLFEPFYSQDILYKIFLHQAILAGVSLSALTEQQIQILPHLINYPLHMHRQYPAGRRPKRMNDLISGRYDTFFQDPAWPRLFPSDEPLTNWLAGHLATYTLAK